MDFQAHTTDELINAINDANNHSGESHTIHLDAGCDYVIDTVHNAINSDPNGTSGLPKVTSTITMVGNGTTIRRDISATQFRLFYVASSGKLTLQGLTLQDGDLRGLSEINGLHGACIRNAGILNVIQCTLQNNFNSSGAGYGGAIYSAAGSTLVMQNSKVFNNEAGYGAVTSDGDLTMTGCVISNNHGHLGVGGVGGIGGTHKGVISHCIIASNYAQDAGGIRWTGVNSGTVVHQLTVTYCDIFLNHATNSGGCLFVDNNSNAVVKLNYNRIFDNYSHDTSDLNRDVYFNPIGFIPAVPNMDATNNWWGANNGPSGTDSNGIPLLGVGDSITTRIDYVKFRDTEEPAHEGADFCPINGAATDSKNHGNPISLRLGEKRLELTDFALQTPAGTLSFTRFYRQFKQSDDPYTFFQLMGLGWTHNHHFYLSDETTNTPPQIAVITPNGGSVVFNIQLSTTLYQAAEGSSSQIAINTGSTTARYVMTASDKSSYEFDSNKKLRKITWPSKEYWIYRYYGDDAGESTHFAKGELKEVVDDGYVIDPNTNPVTKRKLQFVYIQNPTFLNNGVPTRYTHNYLLWRIGDHTASNLTGAPSGRYVEVGYMPERSNGTAGATPKALLANVTDVRNASHQWQYNYYGQLPGETNPSQLNWMTSRQTPNTDTNGDGTADAILTPETLTYSTFQVDLAVNGDMENDSDWTNVGSPSLNVQSTFAVSPSVHSRYVQATQIGQGIQGNVWRLVKGRQYTLSAKVYVKQTSGSPRAKMQVTGTTAFDRTTSSTDTWESLTVTNYIPTSTVDCRLQFVASTLNAEFYVDSVSILETNPQITQKRGLTGSDLTSLLDTTYQFAPGLDYTTETTVNLTTSHQFKWGQYAGSSDPAAHSTQQTIDLQFRTNSQEDANGNATGLNWSDDGKYLNSVVDASGNQTQFKYNTTITDPFVDTLDYSLDAEGRKTKYVYGDTINNPRLPTEIKVYDKDGSTLLRWQKYIYDTVRGRVLEERLLDPADGTGNTVLQKTTRSYYTSGNGSGLLQTVTQVDLVVSNNSVTTTYTYDNLGRVIQTKQSTLGGDCCGSQTTYDNAGNVLSTRNIRDWANLNDNIKNPVTNYAYDEIGRRILTTSNVGATSEQAALTLYDALDRVIRTITNYKNPGGTTYGAPGKWYWDYANQVWKDEFAHVISHGADNTENIISITQYNARGMVKSQQDTLGNVILMGYDDAGRLVKTIQNASIRSASSVIYNNDYIVIANSPNATPDPDLSEYGTVAFPYSTAPDQDIWSVQTHDAVGNLVQTQDVLGTVNFTVYDVLNRPIKMVRSAKDTATIALNPGDTGYVEANDPRSPNYVPDSSPDRDIIETTIYDAMGRVVQQIDVNGRINYTVYDAQGRVSKSITNYVVQLDANGFATDPLNWTWDGNANPKVWRRSTVANDTAIDHGTANDQNIITWTTYDATGRVQWTQDILGRQNFNVYDGLSRVVKTIANYVPQGSTNPLNWVYNATLGRWEDGASNPVNMGSPNADQNRISATNYDINGRVQWTQDTNGRKNWTVYDTQGRTIKTIANCTYISGSPAPESPSYVGSSNSDDDIVTQTTYDSDGRVCQTYDAANHETRYSYDKLGRRTKTVINYNDGIYDPASPDKDLIQTTEYDRAGRVTKTTDARGTQTTFTYDRAGRRLTVTQAANTLVATTSYTCYDKAGRVLRTIRNWRNDPSKPSPDAKDSSGNWLFQPNTYGSDNDSDLITVFAYDQLGRRTRVTDPLGNYSQTSYFKDGSVNTLTDPENMVTVYCYDKLRRRFRVVQSYVPQGTSDPQAWVWESAVWKQSSGGTTIVHGSNQDQNIIVDIALDKAGRVSSQRDPLGRQITYTYDNLDRRITLVRPVSGATTQTWTTTYSDVAGGKTRTTLKNPGITDAPLYDVSRDFDRLGRLTSIQYGDAPTTNDVQMTYDKLSNRLKMSEYRTANFGTLNRETIFTYDDMRRMTSAGFNIDGLGGVDESVSYSYDAGGLRTRLTLPGNLNITYTYDPKGQLDSLTDWDNQQTVFCYDKAGRHVMSNRSNGFNSRYDYDPAGRLRQIRHHQRNKILARFQYNVDGRGNRTSAFEQLAHPATTISTIDKANAAVSYDAGTWTDSGVYKQTSDFFARMKVTFSGNEGVLTIATGIDHSIFDVYIDGSLWESFDGYAASSGERVINFYLESSSSHTLEIRNRPERNSANTTGYKVRFKEVKILSTTYDQQSITYGYDALSRLLNANYSGISPSRSYQYAFDRAGNRTQQVVTVASVPTTTNYTSYNAANQVGAVNGVAMTYDANGNLTNDGTNIYVWDRANRLLSMGGASYQYDGEGRRVQQTVSSVVTKYLLDIQPSLAVVLSETTGANTMRYVHSPRGIHAHKDTGGNWEWMVQDGLGSVREVVDNSVGVLWSTNYDGFGNPFGATGTAQSNYGFTGELVDGSGLLDLRARRYNAGLGTFASLDPFEGVLDRAMSLNRYSWVEGNVPNMVDPSGMIYERPSIWSGCNSDLPATTLNGNTQQGSCQTLVNVLAMPGGVRQFARSYSQGPEAAIELLVNSWHSCRCEFYFSRGVAGSINSKYEGLSHYLNLLRNDLQSQIVEVLPNRANWEKYIQMLYTQSLDPANCYATGSVASPPCTDLLDPAGMANENAVLLWSLNYERIKSIGVMGNLSKAFQKRLASVNGTFVLMFDSNNGVIDWDNCSAFISAGGGVNVGGDAHGLFGALVLSTSKANESMLGFSPGFQ